MGQHGAARHFLLDPIENRSFALFLFRVAQFLHERTNGRVDRMVMRCLAMLRRKAVLPPSAFFDHDEIAGSVVALRERGWWLASRQLDPRDVAEIREFAFSTPAYATNFAERIPINEVRPPQNHNRYEWRMTELLRVGAVQRLLRDSAFHQIAQDYIGCRPVLTSVTLWLDPVFDGPAPAHVYHYDNDGPRFLKFFIYLSDVDTETGAHTYIQGSHSHQKPRRFRLSRRYEREDLLNHYGADSEIVFSAQSGSILAEDTAGFHRGMDPEKGYRLLLQLQFSAIDIPHAEEFATAIPLVAIAGLGAEIAKIVRKFARTTA